MERMRTSIDDPAIACLIDCGAAAHPGLAEPAALRELLAASIARGASDLEARAEDLYLAAACVAGDPAAIAELDRSLPAMIRPALVRLGIAAADHDEIMQRVRVALLVRDPARRPQPLASRAPARRPRSRDHGGAGAQPARAQPGSSPGRVIALIYQRFRAGLHSGCISASRRRLESVSSSTAYMIVPSSPVSSTQSPCRCLVDFRKHLFHLCAALGQDNARGAIPHDQV